MGRPRTVHTLYKKVIMSPYIKIAVAISTTLLVVRGVYYRVDPEAARVRSGSNRLYLEGGGKRLLYHLLHQLRILTSDGYTPPDDVNPGGACVVTPTPHCAPVNLDTRVSPRATPEGPALASLK